jgi:hypothetical protein
MNENDKSKPSIFNAKKSLENHISNQDKSSYDYLQSETPTFLMNRVKNRLFAKATNELEDMFYQINNPLFIVVETFSDSENGTSIADIQVGTVKNDKNLISQNRNNETIDIQTNLRTHYKLQNNILIPVSGNISIPINAKYRNMHDILRTPGNEALITPRAGTVNIYLGKVADNYVSNITQTSHVNR